MAVKQNICQVACAAQLPSMGIRMAPVGNPRTNTCRHYGAVRVVQYLILLSSLLLGDVFVIAIVLAAVLFGSRCFAGQMPFGQVSFKHVCNDLGL